MPVNHVGTDFGRRFGGSDFCNETRHTRIELILKLIFLMIHEASIFERFNLIKVEVTSNSKNITQ